MSDVIEAYPLAWPRGRPRTGQRESSPFRVSLQAALNHVRDEVARLGGANLVISTNLPLRRDGGPRLDARAADPGVAVYFALGGKPKCFACDRWIGVENNLRAIARTIEALRGIDRWGSGDMVAQAFTGFTALPAPDSPAAVLGLEPSATRDEVIRAWRRLASAHHPDRGGDPALMSKINAARDALLLRFGG